VLVIGGLYDPALAEVVNLATGQRCPIKEYPFDLRSATGALVNGQPTVCGGSLNRQECYSYDIANNVWNVFQSMIMGRNDQASSVLDDGRWLISGGGSLPNNQMTFEIYGGGSFSFGSFNFTTRHSTHCQVLMKSHTRVYVEALKVTVDDRYVFLNGGSYHHDPLESWMIDLNTNSIYTLPTFAKPHSSFGRNGPACGLVTKR